MDVLFFYERSESFQVGFGFLCVDERVTLKVEFAVTLSIESYPSERERRSLGTFLNFTVDHIVSSWNNTVRPFVSVNK